MEKLIISILAATMAISIILIIMLPIWWLWSWIIPQIWVTGPASIIKPGYWLFSGTFILFRVIVMAIFGNR